MLGNYIKTLREKKELTTSLKEEESKKKPSKTNTEAIEILSNLTKTWPMANLREKQLILGSLINKIWVDGAKVEIEWSFV